MRLLLGTHTFAARGDSARRQAAAVASMAALGDVDAVNVQLRAAPHEVPGLETLAVLEQDARGVSGVNGLVKPVMSEMFDALAREAARRGADRFAFVNGDIVVLEEAVAAVRAMDDALVVCRLDVTADGTPDDNRLTGQDLFAFRVDWWGAHRRRYRPYITAEGVWDNVYTAITLSHGRAELVTRGALIRHEMHFSEPTAPYARYTQLLAARDSWYFSRWCEYVWGVWAARGRRADPSVERRLQQTVFRPPTLGERAMQAARGALWRARAVLPRA